MKLNDMDIALAQTSGQVDGGGPASKPTNRRILMVDDMPAIHEDFRKVLLSAVASDLDEVESALFGSAAKESSAVDFVLNSAYQGQEALAKVREALQIDLPYALAFIDMRMPPGWDGVETIEHLWREDPRLQIVICTAYADQSWVEVFDRLDARDRLLVLKKPFDPIEVRQLASALTVKWQMTEDAAFKLNQLEQAVEERTRELSDANIIVQNSPTILYRLRGEPSFPLIYISHNITKFGHDPASLLANPDWVSILIDPDDRAKVATAMARVLEKDAQGASIEYRLCTGDGSRRWVENRYVPVRDKEGRLIEVEGIVIDITERKAAEEHIALLARTDGLTGLANRATFTERLHQAFAAAQRGATPFAIHYIDLDHFKPVNDMHGHPAGDLLLREVAQRLRSCTRETDLVARLGGDEFAVLQGEMGEPASAGVLAAKIQKELALPYLVGGNEIRISASIGICPYVAIGSEGPDAMVVQADLALYRSKDEGRNQYRFHSKDLDWEVLDRVTLGDELRKAIDRDELELYYQPQVELSSGKIVGMEALVRWNHPKRGLLNADVFIGIAEKTGSIVALGRWVLNEACRQMRLWRDQGMDAPVVAINLSLGQLKNGRELIRDVAEALAKWQLAPSDLEFDVTEATLAQMTWTHNDVLPQLRELGVRIAIDDFGTEYSSFEYLRAYRVNHLKIAQSMLKRAMNDPASAATIRAIVNLAREACIGIIVEGVETEAQRSFLNSTGPATLAQGYYFSEAVVADEAGKILRRGAIGECQQNQGFADEGRAPVSEIGTRRPVDEKGIRRSTCTAMTTDSIPSQASHPVVEQLPVGIFRKDAAGRFVFVNARFCQLMDSTADQILGRTIEEIAAEDSQNPNTRWRPELVTQARLHHALIMQSGQQVEREETHSCLGSPPQHVQVVESAVLSPEKTIEGSQGVLVDITQRMQTDGTLANERDLLRALLDNSPDHICFKDTQSRFIRSSTAQALQFGMKTADGLVGKSDFDVFSEARARPAFEDEQEIIRTGVPIVGKVERETWIDGRPDTWALTTKMPLRNRDGEIIGTFGISKDISSIKRTEAELAYHHDLLATLMGNSPDSIFFKDLQSRFVKISRSEVNNLLRLSISRYHAAHPGSNEAPLPAHLASADEFERYVIGKTDADIYGQERAGDFSDDEQEIIRTGKPIVEKSEKTVHPDGHVVWYLTTKGPWRDKSGKIIGTFGTSKNMSELKEAQTRIEEVQAQLLITARMAGMAEIATNVLHNVGNVLNSVNVSAGMVSARLRASKLKGLARAMQLMDAHPDDLGEFLTHDARGKLVPGYLRELAQALEDEHAAMAEELGVLVKSIDHIKEVVASQQSYAGASHVVESLKFDELLDDALRMNAGALTRHNVAVVKNIAELPTLPLDRHRLLQILVNLISNAKHAMDGASDQSPCITLGAALVDVEGTRVLHITVTDNGEGIAPENLIRVFAHGFTTRKNGHGFGLHSCVLAAQEMGGTLTARSDGLGQGATFILDIPMIEVPKGRR